jgi:hypothetical protein
MAESATQDTQSAGIERDDDKEAVKQLPRGGNVLPQESHCEVGTNDGSDCCSSRRNIGPQAIVTCRSFVVLGKNIAKAQGDDRENQRREKALGLEIVHN